MHPSQSTPRTTPTKAKDNMRRQSFQSSMSIGSGSGAGEPLIVVEESLLGEEEAERRRTESPPRSVDPDSPSVNPYLLSPWRDARKHSLPTPQCTSGITASQVRRLSERGDGAGPTPREAAFLATLSQSPAPQPGGRRHSVVTISRVPPNLFGRNRRESVAAFPLGSGRILPGRRDSTSSMGMPPSNSGSTHNLQLDIMDDIAEIKAKKGRLKKSKTPSRERICEMQPLEGSIAAQRSPQQRRYSDFATAGGSQMSEAIRRRASEMIPKIPLASTSGQSSSSSTEREGAGLDLTSVLSSLTSSAMDITRCGLDEAPSKGKKRSGKRGGRSKGSRSNSFDLSILDGSRISPTSRKPASSPSSWFSNRHKPIDKKRQQTNVGAEIPSTIFESFNSVKKGLAQMLEPAVKSPPSDDRSPKRGCVARDDKSGAKGRVRHFGSAIEDFLTSKLGSDNDNASGSSATSSPNKSRSTSNKMAAWFTGTAKEEEQKETCESSLCSTLKDLFVK